jgi:predicted dehydrogenase
MRTLVKSFGARHVESAVATAAVIGCGDVSIVHLEAIAAVAESQLIAVCDADTVTAAAVARDREVVPFTDHRQMLQTVRPDVVHICTPHDQHAQLAIDCLEAGVSVILEKPLAHNVSEAERVIAAANRHPNVKIGVCLQNRYNATVQAAHALLASDELGPVVGSSATLVWHRTPDYYRSRPWRGQFRRSGGGVLINQAIHTLDLLQWLIGDVAHIRGHAGRYGLDDDGLDIEDTAHMVLDHQSGTRSLLFATVANVIDSPVTLELVTERAVLFIRGDLTITYSDGRVEVVTERRARSKGRGYWGVSHELLIADFYRRLDDPEPFWISPAEGMKSLQIIEQVYALSGWPA